MPSLASEPVLSRLARTSLTYAGPEHISAPLLIAPMTPPIFIPGSDPAPSVTRRAAVALGLAALLTPVSALDDRVPGDLLFAGPGSKVKHPTPRPGITASAVLDPSRVPKRSREAYEAAKAVPEVLDGLYCHCHCAEHRGMRSLLSCLETEMPLTCRICKGEARLAYRSARQGKTLDAIRAAVDAA